MEQVGGPWYVLVDWPTMRAVGLSVAVIVSGARMALHRPNLAP